MSQKKVDVADLTLGMYVVELDRPWLETPFLFQGFPILSQEELKQLRSCCNYVYVDEQQSVTIKPEHAAQSPHGRPVKRFGTRRLNLPGQERSVPPNRRRFEQVLPQAKAVYEQAHRYINDIFEEIRIGRTLSIDQARSLTDETVDSLMDNENTLVWLTLLKRKDEYTSFHSINVCVLSVLFGRYLGLSEDELRVLGLGALLHDIGKMRVPLAILNKSSRLSSEEMAQMQQHPALGVEILADSSGIPPQVREIVHSHHERIDGSGYPRGLEGDEIGLYPMLVSIADVYDAMTSDRAYHLRISPHEALNVMYGWASSHFPEELLEAFIRCLGIYPVGSLVELSSGEVGVVLTVNRENHLSPTLLLVLDRNKAPYDLPKTLNLELQQRAGVKLSITKILPSHAYDLDVRELVAQNGYGALPAA
ncbi:MAG: HD-GYP domain-containing protein [Pseudomonadota bacterium]